MSGPAEASRAAERRQTALSSVTQWSRFSRRGAAAPFVVFGERRRRRRFTSSASNAWNSRLRGRVCYFWGSPRKKKRGAGGGQEVVITVTTERESEVVFQLLITRIIGRGRWPFDLFFPPQELNKKGYGAITTEILQGQQFYYAEDQHQQYLKKVPRGYCGLKGTGVSCPIGAGKDELWASQRWGGAKGAESLGLGL